MRNGNRRLLTILKIGRRWRAAWIPMALALGLSALGGCAWLDTKQRQLIYRPTPGVPAHFTGLRVGDEQFFLPVPATPQTLSTGEAPITSATAASPPAPQRIEMWWLPNADPDAPTLLYLHGTFRTLVANVRKIEALRTAGFSVLAVEYRGWGLSTPIIPSEKTILQDADIAWAELVRREPRPQQRFIFGHSMGSGVAVDLASRQRPQSDYAGLILESAFTSFPDIASELNSVAGVIALSSDERFASIDKIKRVQQPLLMIHGNLDKTVPMVLGERLFAAANPPKTWVMIDGGRHSDLDDKGRELYQQAVRQFRATVLAGAASPDAGARSAALGPGGGPASNDGPTGQTER